ncbi:hypothetical protein ACWGDE_13225 [Streptomyces sp. NPDC054956]
MWNHVQTTERPRQDHWSGIAPGAEAVGGAQLFCAVLYWQISSLAEEPYGRGYGGGIAVLFWMFLMLVCGPFLMIGLGYVHSALVTTPVMELSNAAGVRTRVSAPWWALPVLGAIAAVYAVPVSLLDHTSYAATWGWIAVYGVLPVAVSVFARMRQVPRGRVRRWAILPALAAVIATFWFGATAPAYRPPVLAGADYVGEWEGDGVRLELGAEGEAKAVKVPVTDAFEQVGSCSGPGTWVPVEADDFHRGGVFLKVPDCKGRAELRWDVAGTARKPELFVLIGDPDDGDVRVLHKRTP